MVRQSAEDAADSDRYPRRRSVRYLRGLRRRLEATTRPLGPTARRLRAVVDRVALTVAAVPSRLAVARRRADLTRALDQSDPTPGASTVSIISLERARLQPSQGLDVLAQAVAVATSDQLCFAPEPLGESSPGWVARLSAALGDDVVAATPTLVHPLRRGLRATEHDLLVESEGYELEADGSGVPVLRARGAGSPPDIMRSPVEVAAAPLRGLVVDRRAYLAAGGLSVELADDEVSAAADLCARLQRAGGRIVHVPAAVIVDDQRVPTRRRLREPTDPTGTGWRRFLERNGADAARRASITRPGDPPRWVITTAVPARHVAPGWGDWHVAQALARSLRRLGHDVEVQSLDEADSLSSLTRDIRLVIRGLAPVPRVDGQTHVLWVISHPEAVEVAECDEADLVLVASERFAAHLRERTSTPVAVMLQATDAHRFRPLEPVAAHRHPVTVVAKTRDVMRPVVADAIAAGVRPAIYGGGWRSLIDPTLVVADHVDNDQLPAIYSSADVVLNDHWESMREWGFVSNRVFDVLACATPIISDELRELHDLFGTAVTTYRSPEELADRVRDVLADPQRAKAAAAAGRDLVVRSHTFDDRARQLMVLLDEHGLRLPRK